MRDIKFRAWQDDQMWTSPISSNFGLNRFFGALYEDAEIMQYTGLKDKNGNEIYEGDICKAPHDFGPGGFYEKVFSVSFDLQKGYQWNYWNMEIIEVIGNIYENPDILKTHREPL